MRRILVIDDEEWLREMIDLALSQKGFEVLQAASGEAGVERPAATKAKPTTVVTTA